MSELTESPELKAQLDYHFGGNQSTNPYPVDKDPNSDFQRYAWEIHRLASEDFKADNKDVIRRVS